MNFRIPALLQTLVETGWWSHPGDDVLRREIPCLLDPVDFRCWLPYRTVATELEGSFSPEDWRTFKMYRDVEPVRTCPWLSADQAVFIAIDRFPGDDVAIALDYRSDLEIPMVVASHWRDNKSLEWFEVAKDFEIFARSLGLVA